MDIFTQGDLIVVYWIDTVDNSSWQNIKLVEVDKPALVKSVGWFINEDDSCIRVATSASGILEKEMDVGSIIIPKGMIQKIEKIREDELDVEINA
jgi:hypothetical protein